MRNRSLLLALCLLSPACKSKSEPAKVAPAKPAAPVAKAPTADAAPAAPAEEPEVPPPPITVGPVGYATAEIALPGGGPDGIGMDFIAYDAHTDTVWVPAGPTGSVDVIEAKTGKLTRIEGFPTQEMERRGKKRIVGPSAVSVGDGVVYIGNRGDFTVCALDEKTQKKGTCSAKLDAMPDCVVYVAPTKEVWVTTPRDKSIRILDAKTLAEKAKLSFDGEPEAFAVDAKRGRFYTNLEDKDVTLAIDLKSHATLSTWKTTCGEDGGHGLALDEAAGWLFVACSARAEVMDVGHDGAVLSSIDTGDGVDLLDYVAATHMVYVGSSRAARLTIATVDAKGALTLTAQVPTKAGARNPVVDGAGKVYLSASKDGVIVVASPPPPATK